MFTALLGYLVSEDWATPKIEELRISPDRCILARVAGDVFRKTFIGAEANPVRKIHGVAEVAGLDVGENGYLLGKVAEIKGINQWRPVARKSPVSYEVGQLDGSYVS